MTPPRDHRATTFQLKQNPELSIENYRKVLSPFAGAYEAGAKLAQSNPASGEKVRRIDTHEDPAAKEALRRALQDKFRRVYESPQSGKHSRPANLTYEAPLKPTLEPVQAAKPTPAKQPARAESRSDSKRRAASFAELPLKPVLPAQPRKQSDSHVGVLPAPQDANRYFQPPRMQARPHTAHVETTPRASPPVRDVPDLAPTSQTARVQRDQHVEQEPPTPSGLSACSQCSGARAKGMEYICVHCENKERETEKAAAMARNRELERQRGEASRGQLEAAREKELLELNAFRQRMNADMLAAMQDHNAKQARLKDEG
jgi:hypothetical protein